MVDRCSIIFLKLFDGCVLFCMIVIVLFIVRLLVIRGCFVLIGIVVIIGSGVVVKGFFVLVLVELVGMGGLGVKMLFFGEGWY